MPNVEWENIEHLLEAPDWHGGTNYLYMNSPAPVPAAGILNDPTERYMLLPDKCKAERDLRLTRTFRPQNDGELVHRKFAAGLQFDLAVELWTADDGASEPSGPACDTQRRIMYDKLSGQLYAIIRDYGGWVWAPSTIIPIPDRRLNLMQLVDGPKQERDGIFTVVTFSLRSPFPYAVNDELLTTSVGDGSSTLLANEGTAPYYPIVRVYGPTDTVTVENVTTGQSLVYLGAGALPGSISIPGGDYADFDFWEETAFLSDGVTRLKAGIDLSATDFWTLVPGDNQIATVGANVDILWRIAWA